MIESAQCFLFWLYSIHKIPLQGYIGACLWIWFLINFTRSLCSRWINLCIEWVVSTYMIMWPYLQNYLLIIRKFLRSILARSVVFHFDLPASQWGPFILVQFTIVLKYFGASRRSRAVQHQSVFVQAAATVVVNATPENWWRSLRVTSYLKV
jgi:hypothetical protein